MNASCNTWTDRLIGKSLQHSFSYFWYYLYGQKELPDKELVNTNLQGFRGHLQHPVQNWQNRS